MKANTLVLAGTLLALMTSGSALLGQASTNEVAQLEQRVSQLEKQVREISQFLEPLKGQQSIVANRRKALQGKWDQRMALDREKYSEDQVLEAEKLYLAVSQKPGSSEANESFQTLLKKYPDYNRTGCALLYIAQRSQGDERIKRLQECIEKYNDCFYGDAVQVGVYARFLLAKEYSRMGDDKQAEVLVIEIKTNYADAVDHGGNLLVELLAPVTK